MSVPPNDNTVQSNESLLDLPPVQAPQQRTESTPVPAAEPVKQQGTERNPELLPTQPANQDQPTQQPQPDPASTPTAPPQDQPIAADPLATTAAVPNPQIADDIDLIEKEWVEKAKSIVAKTKEDPRAQNQQLNQVKAEYIKQRFNKELRPQ